MRDVDEKVVANHLYLEDDPGPAERVVFDLAVEIEKRKNPGYISVSWESQQEAVNYINQHGFEEALSHLQNLQDDN